MCGVIGVIGSPEAAPEAAKEAFLGLITLQHRGQDAAGILSYENIKEEDSASLVNSGFHLTKNLGLVENVFSQEAVAQLRGHCAIGHTRYSTIGKGDLMDVQPLLLNYPYGIGMVHNGNIVNYLEVKRRLQKEMKRRCLTHSDSETILNWFAHHLKQPDFDNIFSAASEVIENIFGSYSIVGLLGEAGLFAFRDPNGIRPLVLGKKTVNGKVAYMVASETIPLSFLGYEYQRDLLPGEVLFIDHDMNVHSKCVLKKESPNPCMFEWVYFASAESSLENTPVYGVRLELGRNLAKLIQQKINAGEIEADLVAPVPDTSRTAATALAEELGLPYREVLIKNRYITRTFILGSQSKREKAVDLKLNTVASEIKGKSIILVDDSIVRGTTSKKIVQLVRRAGAKKVYFVSSCPPIRYPCFYGIDFPDQEELIASRLANGSEENLEKKIADELGADGVVYLNLDGLTQSLKTRSEGKVQSPCVACLNGCYPVEAQGAIKLALLRKTDRGVAH